MRQLASWLLSIAAVALYAAQASAADGKGGGGPVRVRREPPPAAREDPGIFRADRGRFRGEARPTGAPELEADLLQLQGGASQGDLRHRVRAALRLRRGPRQARISAARAESGQPGGCDPGPAR